MADPLSRRHALQPITLILAGCKVVNLDLLNAGQLNENMDLPKAGQLNEISENNTIFDALLRGYQLDESFENPEFVRNFIKSPKGLWLKQEGEKRLVFVPNVKPIRNHLIFVHHSLSLAGHPGRAKTIELL